VTPEQLTGLREALAELGFTGRQREQLIRQGFRTLGIPMRRATEDDLYLVLDQSLPDLIRQHIPPFRPVGRYLELMRALSPDEFVAGEEGIPVKITDPESRRRLLQLLDQQVRGIAGVYFLWSGGREIAGEEPSAELLNVLANAARDAERAGGKAALLSYENHTYALWRTKDGTLVISLYPWAGHGVLLSLLDRLVEEE